MKTTLARPSASLSRTRSPERVVVRVAAVQFSWRENPAEHRDMISEAVRTAAAQGAKIVFLPELTLSRYPADVCPTSVPVETAEDLETGATMQLVSSLAKELRIFVQASVFENRGFSDG